MAGYLRMTELLIFYRILMPESPGEVDNSAHS